MMPDRPTSEAPRSRLPTVIRRPFARHPWALEVVLFALALVIYQVSRAVVIGDAQSAFRNAADVIRWEKSSGLFVELNVQQFVLNHLSLTKALNYFYMYAHWTVTPLFFVWLYRRRSRAYPYVRNAFFAANAIALAVFVLFPVAPPRLLSAGGFVDTLHKISDIDLHGGRLAGWFNPYAAVPSMHFGYALMIGWSPASSSVAGPAPCGPRLPRARVRGDHRHSEPLRDRQPRRLPGDRRGLPDRGCVGARAPPSAGGGRGRARVLRGRAPSLGGRPLTPPPPDRPPGRRPRRRPPPAGW